MFETELYYGSYDILCITLAASKIRALMAFYFAELDIVIAADGSSRAGRLVGPFMASNRGVVAN